MIRNISDGEAEAGAGKTKTGGPDPDPSPAGTSDELSELRPEESREAAPREGTEASPRGSVERAGEQRNRRAGEQQPRRQDESGGEPADDGGSHDSQDDDDDDGVGDDVENGDQDGTEADVIERGAIGLEAVGLDSVEGPRPRSIATSRREPSSSAPETAPPCDPAELKGAVESILFSLSEPIGIRALSELVGVSVHEVRGVVEELRYEYVDSQRAFRLEEIAGGVQLLTQSRYDPWVGRLRQKEKEGRLSAAALETLAVVAYKQPITKADLEGIRGVGCSPILKTLMDRGLLQVVGRDEGLGKPLLYGTTKRFLESFGLESVRDLPQPEDVSGEDAGGPPAGGAPES